MWVCVFDDIRDLLSDANFIIFWSVFVGYLSPLTVCFTENPRHLPREGGREEVKNEGCFGEIPFLSFEFLSFFTDTRASPTQVWENGH